MKTNDRDMKLMALGEIGAFLLAIVAAVGAWKFLNETEVPLRIIVVFAVMYFSGSYALRFVHLGYKPGGTKS